MHLRSASRPSVPSSKSFLIRLSCPLPPSMSNSHSDSLDRLKTQELEIGATEAVARHFSRHVVERRPVSQRRLNFEHSRPRWLREMAAEATGVFFYGPSVLPLLELHLTPPSLPRRRLHCHLHSRIIETHAARLRLPLPNRLGLRPWHRLRHHHLRAHLWRPLQPSNHDQFRGLAGLPLAQGTILYLRADPRCGDRWPDGIWAVP